MARKKKIEITELPVTPESWLPLGEICHLYQIDMDMALAWIKNDEVTCNKCDDRGLFIPNNLLWMVEQGSFATRCYGIPTLCIFCSDRIFWQSPCWEPLDKKFWGCCRKCKKDYLVIRKKSYTPVPKAKPQKKYGRRKRYYKKKVKEQKPTERKYVEYQDFEKEMDFTTFISSRQHRWKRTSTQAKFTELTGKSKDYMRLLLSGKIAVPTSPLALLRIAEWLQLPEGSEVFDAFMQKAENAPKPQPPTVEIDPILEQVDKKLYLASVDCIYYTGKALGVTAEQATKFLIWFVQQAVDKNLAEGKNVYPWGKEVVKNITVVLKGYDWLEEKRKRARELWRIRQDKKAEIPKPPRKAHPNTLENLRRGREKRDINKAAKKALKEAEKETKNE